MPTLPTDYQMSSAHNGQFGKIFAINLPERTDHRDALLLAGTLTGLEIDIVNGIRGETVEDKALPYPATKEQIVVEDDLETALIMEDDVDWDISIKQQLFDYALTVRALTQPPIAKSENGSSSNHLLEDPESSDHSSYNTPGTLNITSLPPTIPPQHSPYGDNWDILW
ncbi:MAG: hypothetical protein Q9227_007734 [Pyrenula ochraceoflavens]